MSGAQNKSARRSGLERSDLVLGSITSVPARRRHLRNSAGTRHEVDPTDVHSRGKRTFQRRAGIMDITEADWDRIHRVNAKGVFFCLQTVARVMIPLRSGRIINIASIAG